MNAPVGGVMVDHLVVAARTLEDGVAWCEATLGVTPATGGKHPLMGTHNRLVKIAGEAFPDSYLEIIAIDPAAPAPGRARWFALDETDLSGGPRLVHWVARSTQLDMHRWGLINVGQAPGDPIAAHRDTPAGRLAWQILVRDDGRLLCGGALPTLIQWQGGHPAAALPDSGVTLTALSLAGLPDRVRDVLRLRGIAVSSGPGAAVTATLATPKGDVVLQTGETR